MKLKKVLLTMTAFCMLATAGCASSQSTGGTSASAEAGTSADAAETSAGAETPADDDEASADAADTADTEAAATEDEPGAEDEAASAAKAVYLGVEGYGEPETNKDNKENFRYRFEIDGTETVYTIDNGTKGADGEYDYPIQNMLKEGYSYEITVEDDVVTAVSELLSDTPDYTPAVSGTPGLRTVKNFLQTALMPVGTSLYIYGGGWDWQDAGSSIQSRTLGVSPDWVRFFNEHDDSFTYKGVDGDEENVDPTVSYFPFGEYNEYYYAGLDCSGYLGWVLYNTFETESGLEGYVGSSTKMARNLGEKGLGTWENILPDRIMKPGDIMSINGHVWISLGTCDDGSVLIAHSTPSDSRSGQPGGGVQVSAIGPDTDCEAYKIADSYMSEHHPGWYERYETVVRDPEVYFVFEGENAGRFSWDTENSEDGLTDPDGIRGLSPDKVLEMLLQ